jgi:hypothetical protein
MRINGEWLLCDDGILRPIVRGVIRVTGDDLVETLFLLDAGADRTIFSADLPGNLQVSETHEAARGQVVGVGGPAEFVRIQTTISFDTESGRRAQVRGEFAAFTQMESADLSVLGRDVTNNFSVIYDYSSRTVVLLARPHFYEIKSH